MSDSPTANRDHDPKNILSRAMSVWFILIAAEIVHGILRTIFLVPLVGEFRPNQMGVFGGSAIILAIAYLTIAAHDRLHHRVGFERCCVEHKDEHRVINLLGDINIRYSDSRNPRDDEGSSSHHHIFVILLLVLGGSGTST